MASLERGLRKQLENTVWDARRAAEQGASEALAYLGVDTAEAPAGVDRNLRKRLRAHGRQLGDLRDDRSGTQALERLVGECAYEHWHRLLFARFLAENDLLVEHGSGMPLSLGECQELARERGQDWLLLASDFAQRMLPQIFRAGDPVLEVALPPEKRQELERLLGSLPREVFLADDSLGWVYQFWQAEQKERVNKSEKKIGAEELPAVTQLFTEDYMVLFLLHNTLGAWWAGKVLAKRPEMARDAESEEALRQACALPGMGWEYLRFVKEEGGEWRPAAGIFDGWPKAAKDITVLDPCMGSGHFLVFAFGMMVALRMAEEGSSEKDAVDAVLHDNLFGLEIDPRCTQIAAFNLALAAWRKVGHRALPKLNLACSGLSLSARKDDWVALAGANYRLRTGMDKLYELFQQAPVLGSLINPRAEGATLLEAGFDDLAPLLERAIEREKADAEKHELAVTAAGMAKAAALLAGSFTLVATNVPYLARGKQHPLLSTYCSDHFNDAKTDLATCFVRRSQLFIGDGNTAALIAPQSWLSQDFYESFRKRILRSVGIEILVQLGPGAFEGITGEVVKPLLIIYSRRAPGSGNLFSAADTTACEGPHLKSAQLRLGPLLLVSQLAQTTNPRTRIHFEPETNSRRIRDYAIYSNGIQTGDSPRFIRTFWELKHITDGWAAQQTTVTETTEYGGMSQVLLWEDGSGILAAYVREKLGTQATGAWLRGRDVWGKRGVIVSAMGTLHASLYNGDLFDDNTVAIIPHSEADLPALWTWCSNSEYRAAVRKISKKLNVRGPLVETPFDLPQWKDAALRDHPSGLPLPKTTDLTQWLFAGQPALAASALQAGTGRLLGYRWPRQTGSSFMDAPALGPDGLEKHADEDGIVCLTPIKGEPAAADRLQALLADAFGAEWSPARLHQLLDEVGFGGKTLDDWLRDGFFEQHCELFHHRPFVWHLWDGLRDGFHALVNYHKLAAPNGGGQATLEKLMYSYLGDWLDRQRADRDAGVEGADGRLAAAQHLQRQLKNILEGEPPYDLFVRWKPLHEQPIGWEPDINDGVRLNIRPFMTARPLAAKAKNACILRVTPKIKWEKDRGKEPYRLREDYPWFWGWDGTTPDFRGGTEPDGNRWNDLHYPRETKRAAREAQGKGTHE